VPFSATVKVGELQARVGAFTDGAPLHAHTASFCVTGIAQCQFASCCILLILEGYVLMTYTEQLQ
jgi:hypothetical protein